MPLTYILGSSASEDMYISIREARFPEMILELMAYMSTIVWVNTPDLSGSNMLFCKHTALRKETMWLVINPTIYVRCFTTATSNPPRCKICLAVTHKMKDCNISEGDIEGDTEPVSNPNMA